MRFEGSLKTGGDDRGFGFVELDQGGQEVFLRIKAFSAGTCRPRPGQRPSYEIGLGAQRKKRAKNVQSLRAAGRVRCAQQLRRHNSNKPRFRTAFWATGALNVAALASRRFV